MRVTFNKTFFILLLLLGGWTLSAQESGDCPGELRDMIDHLGMAIAGGHEAVISISECMHENNLDSASICVSHFVNLSYEALGPISDADCHLDRALEESGQNRELRHHKEELKAMKVLVHDAFKECRKAYTTAHTAMELGNTGDMDKMMMDAVQSMTQSIEWMSEAIGIYERMKD